MKNYKKLIGSGDKIILTTIAIALILLYLNSIKPAFFTLPETGQLLRTLILIIFICGVVFWLWSVYLIITIASKDRLITTGPYSIVKHPIYTSVGLLVIPFGGLLLNSWLGVLIGLVLYLASRKFAPEEENELLKNFKNSWTKYKQKVILHWL